MAGLAHSDPSLQAPKRGKHGNLKCKFDGIVFDSGEEGIRYLCLKDMLAKGQIACLKLQVPYKFEINGVLVCTYIADFQYVDKATGDLIVEDVKGRIIPVYVINRKLMKAIYGIEIREVINGKVQEPGRKKPKKKKLSSLVSAAKKKR